MRDRLAAESAVEREARLQRMRINQSERLALAAESAEEREDEREPHANREQSMLCTQSYTPVPHGQYAYSGHVINLPQDVAFFANSLPRLPSELNVMIVRKEELPIPIVIFVSGEL